MSTGERFNPDFLVLSENYADTMERVVMPYLKARGVETMLPCHEGRRLRCLRFDAESPRGTVVVVHGFTENADKFAELCHSLLRNHFSVLAYDQRGHGFSWRPEGLEDISVTHVERFEEYILDLEIVCARLLASMPKPWMVFAHSMGGAVTTLYLEKHPDAFARCALCAPMIAPNCGMPGPLCRAILGAAKLTGKGRKRTFVSRPYVYPDDFDTSCATGRARFDWYEERRRDTPEYQNNSPSYNWTLEAVRVTAKILGPGRVERVGIPVRVFTAQMDHTVLPQAQERFAQRLKNGRREIVQGAKHEIYRSTDDVLFPWWREILDFFGEAE